MPTLTDTGQAVTLDLHGARVDEALRMARRAFALAVRRGRRRLDLVHGTSTSDRFGHTRTIKHALHDWLDSGEVGAVQAQRGETVLTLYLDLTKPTDAARIVLRDVWT